MSLMNIIMVPLIMACALGGTVGLLWLIRRFQNKENNNGSYKERQ